MNYQCSAKCSDWARVLWVVAGCATRSCYRGGTGLAWPDLSLGWLLNISRITSWRFHLPQVGEPCISGSSEAGDRAQQRASLPPRLTRHRWGDRMLRRHRLHGDRWWARKPKSCHRHRGAILRFARDLPRILEFVQYGFACGRDFATS